MGQRVEPLTVTPTETFKVEQVRKHIITLLSMYYEHKKSIKDVPEKHNGF